MFIVQEFFPHGDLKDHGENLLKISVDSVFSVVKTFSACPG
jgi:hypothetical protein